MFDLPLTKMYSLNDEYVLLDLQHHLDKALRRDVLVSPEQLVVTVTETGHVSYNGITADDYDYVLVHALINVIDSDDRIVAQYRNLLIFDNTTQRIIRFVPTKRVVDIHLQQIYPEYVIILEHLYMDPMWSNVYIIERGVAFIRDERKLSFTHHPEEFAENTVQRYGLFVDTT